MPNPATEPIIGSSFDSLAGQRQSWAGFNAGIERANLEAQARAEQERNQYLFNAAQLARQDQARQDSLQEGADRDTQHQYEFGQTMDFQNRELAARQQAEKDSNAATAAKKGAQLATDKTNLRIQQAQAEIQARTFNPANYADLPKDTLTFLNRIDATQRAQEQKSYFDSMALAGKLNQKAVLEKQVSQGAPVTGNNAGGAYSWYNPLRYDPLNIAGSAAGVLSVPTPDTSWFTDYQKRLAGLQTELAPYQIDKVGAAQYGLTLNPANGRYEPVSVPPWMSGAGAPATTPASAPAPAPAPVQSNGPKVLDINTARQLLAQAGGDKNAARQLAVKLGYTIQPLQ